MKARVIFYRRGRSESGIITIAIGLVYLWFGTLKFFPGVSPAEGLALETVRALTLDVFSDRLAIILLAFWEVSVGLFLIFNLFRKVTLYVAFLHILLTFTPFIFFPDMIFTQAPFGLTLVGQYIIKNLIILGILVVLIKQLKDH
ncbi:MAG: doxx family protein [Eudoraea sp.]|nr:doxx family protein [Eudoraea sp.]NNJ40438.1 doxx family protein [Eudoraea sp.]